MIIISLLAFNSPFLITKAKPNANLVFNGSFEGSDMGWSVPYGSRTIDSSTSTDGSSSLSFIAGFYFNNFISELRTQTPITVTAGQYYDYNVDIKSDDRFLVGVSLFWSNSDVDVSYSSLFNTSVTDWQSFSGTI